MRVSFGRITNWLPELLTCALLAEIRKKTFSIYLFIVLGMHVFAFTQNTQTCVIIIIICLAFECIDLSGVPGGV